MERFTALDAGFVEAEDADRHVSLAIGAVAVLSGPMPDYEAVVSAIANGISLKHVLAGLGDRREGDTCVTNIGAGRASAKPSEQLSKAVFGAPNLLCGAGNSTLDAAVAAGQAVQGAFEVLDGSARFEYSLNDVTQAAVTDSFGDDSARRTCVGCENMANLSQYAHDRCGGDCIDPERSARSRIVDSQH